MKKIIIPITFTVLLVLSLASCGNSDTAVETVSEEIASVESYTEIATQTQQGIALSSEYQMATISFQNESYPLLYHSIYSLSMSGLLDNSWDSSDQNSFTPDQVVKYAFYFQSDSNNDGQVSTTLSASEVETTASFAFGVDASFLQTSSFYQTNNTYSLPTDEAVLPVIMINSPDFSRGQVTVLWMGLTSEELQTYHIIGETYVSFVADDAGENFTFNSCAYTDYQLHDTESSTESAQDSVDSLAEDSVSEDSVSLLPGEESAA